MPWSSIDGVALPDAIPHLDMAPVDLNNVDSGSKQVPGEAGAVGSHAFDAEGVDNAKGGCRVQQSPVAVQIRGKSLVSKHPAVLVDGSGMVDQRVRIHTQW
jgi:hypothetical protein